MSSKSDTKSRNASVQSDTAETRSRFVFEFPPLPKGEITVYFAFVIGAIIYAYYRIYEASRAYRWNSNGLSWAEYEDQELPFGLGTFRKDISDSEWHWWASYAISVLPWMVGHCLLFNLLDGRLPDWVMLGYWIAAHCHIYSIVLTVVTFAQGLLFYWATKTFRSRVLLWVLACATLYLSMQNPLLIPEGIDESRAITLLSYKVLHYLSYTFDILNAERQQKSTEEYSAAEMIRFGFYLPYSISLIVTSDDLRRQFRERKTQPLQTKSTLFFGLRMLFWYCVAESCLYIFYIQALIQDPNALRHMRKDTMVNVAMANGHFFHLKYVVIFGYPAFFARVDRMQPLPGPICISRLTLYSKLWRFFDRGLYAWFRKYFFDPICQPTYSVPRKLFALSLIYAFVLLWHGEDRQYMMWIILSVVEILLEQTAKGIYRLKPVSEWRKANISDANFRRLIGWLHTIVYACGLYANIYFVSNDQSGDVFVERIFWQETVHLGRGVALLFFLGYCLANVYMESERFLRKSKIDEQKQRQD